MERLQASVITMLAVFLLAITFVPVGPTRQLVRTIDQNLAVVNPGLRRTERSPPLTSSTRDAESLLKWRMAYSKHYESLDSKRATDVQQEQKPEFAYEILGKSSEQDFHITPANHRSDGVHRSVGVRNNANQASNFATGLDSVNDSERLEVATAAQAAAYWGNIHQQSELQLARIRQPQANPIPAEWSPGLSVVTMLPGHPSHGGLFLATAVSITLGFIRFFSERAPIAIGHRPEINEPGMMLQVFSADAEIDFSNVTTLSIILPECWLTSSTVSRLAQRLDSISLTLLSFITIAILWRISHQPIGLHRLIWWPLAELASIW